MDKNLNLVRTGTPPEHSAYADRSPSPAQIDRDFGVYLGFRPKFNRHLLTLYNNYIEAKELLAEALKHEELYPIVQYRDTDSPQEDE